MNNDDQRFFDKYKDQFESKRFSHSLTCFAYDNGKNIRVTYIGNKEKAPVGAYLIRNESDLADSLSALGEPHYKEIAEFARFIIYSYRLNDRDLCKLSLLDKAVIKIGNVIFNYEPYTLGYILKPRSNVRLFTFYLEQEILIEEVISKSTYLLKERE